MHENSVTSWLRRAGRVALLALLALPAASDLLPAEAGAAAHDVRIVRDEYGVPHVYADDLAALYFGFGHVIAQGPTKDVLNDRRVMAAYLGTAEVQV